MVSTKKDEQKNNQSTIKNRPKMNTQNIESETILFTGLQYGNFTKPTKTTASKFKVPETEVKVGNNEFEIIANLPGCKIERLELSIDTKSVNIKCPTKNSGYYTELNLPEEIIPQSSIAKFSNDTLKLKISKRNENMIWKGLEEQDILTTTLKETKERLSKFQEQFHAIQLEYQNLLVKNKKEVENRIDNFKITVIEKVIKNIDNFKLALKSSENRKNKDTEQILVGLRLILNELNNLLKEEGVEEIPTKGLLLDPHLHEVVDCTETDKYPEDTILDVLQKGYRFKTRVIRPSKVRVAIAPKVKRKDGKK